MVAARTTAASRGKCIDETKLESAIKLLHPKVDLDTITVHVFRKLLSDIKFKGADLKPYTGFIRRTLGELNDLKETPARKKRNQKNAEWGGMYKKVKDFYSKHGHLHLQEVDGANTVFLEKWLRMQLDARDAVALSAVQIKLLEYVGVQWDNDQWLGKASGKEPGLGGPQQPRNSDLAKKPAAKPQNQKSIPLSTKSPVATKTAAQQHVDESAKKPAAKPRIQDQKQPAAKKRTANTKTKPVAPGPQQPTEPVIDLTLNDSTATHDGVPKAVSLRIQKQPKQGQRESLETPSRASQTVKTNNTPRKGGPGVKQKELLPDNMPSTEDIKGPDHEIDVGSLDVLLYNISDALDGKGNLIHSCEVYINLLIKEALAGSQQEATEIKGSDAYSRLAPLVDGLANMLDPSIPEHCKIFCKCFTA